MSDPERTQPPADERATLGLAGSATPGDCVAVPGYEILGELGRGGMGVVYKARQVGLGRACALKMILSGGHASADDLARFRREAEAIARLSHPNIVQVYEVGEHESVPYFSLEFCEGGSLEKRLGGTPLPGRDAAELVETLSRAVAAAHEAGVVHRDLKPANVLLSEDKSYTTHTSHKTYSPKITDFGLAKRLDDVSRTTTGAIMGTPSYMAPEQAEAKKDVGPPADIWALGAILYECLTGRPPFRAATALDTILQVVSEEPASPRSLNPNLPRDLETIALMCLSKEPARRYKTAGDLADDLRRHLAGEPIAARPAGRAERIWRWARRNPAVATLALASALLLIAGTAVSTLFALQAQHQANIAEDKADEAKREGERARRGERDLRYNLYLSRITQAQLAYQAGQLGRAQELLRQTAPTAVGEDLRAFEWHYLDRLCHSESMSLGDGQPASCVAYSPDGERLAFAGGAMAREGGRIVVCDAKTGAELRRMDHGAPVHRVAFSPDGRHLSSCGGGIGVAAIMPRLVGTVKVWNVATGEMVSSFPGTQAAAFSPDGAALVTVRAADKAWKANLIALVDWRAGKDIKTFVGSDQAIAALAFDPTGQRLAVGGLPVFQVKGKRLFAALIQVWDVAKAEQLVSCGTVPGEQFDGGIGMPAASVAYSADGKRLLSASGMSSIVWDASSGKRLTALPQLNDAAHSVAFHRDGKHLAACSANGTAYVWDDEGAEPRTLLGHAGPASEVCFPPGGKHLAVAGASGVKVWELARAPGTRRITLPARTNFEGQPAFHPDGKRLALGEATVYVLDLAQGKTRPLPNPDKAERSISLRYTPDGRRLLRLARDGGRGTRLAVLDAETGGELMSFPTPRSSLINQRLHLSRDGRLVAHYAERSAHLFDLVAGKALAPIPLAAWNGMNIAFGPEPSQLAILCAEKGGSSVLLRDLDKGEDVWRAPLRDSANRLSLSGDGRTLIAQGQAGVTGLRAGDGVERWRISVPGLLRGEFSHDGRRMATVAQDGQVALWDTATGQQLLSLRGGQIPLPVVFSPDGSLLVQNALDGKTFGLLVWDGSPRRP